MQIMRAETPEDVLISMYAIRELGTGLCRRDKVAMSRMFDGWLKEWREYDNCGDGERHQLMDELMRRVLNRLGFRKAMTVYSETHKWHS